MKDKARKYLFFLFLGVFLVSGIMLLRTSLGSHAQAQADEIARQLARATEATLPPETALPPETQAPPETTEATEPPAPVWVPAEVEPDETMLSLGEINLDALREVNPDVIGWICLPGTPINYPIVKGEDNSYYLSHTWDDRPSGHGSIFQEATCSADWTDFHTIVYGHNMNDGSMFAGLQNYYSQYWINTYPYVYLVTDEGVLRYEIFSSYLAKTDSLAFGLGFSEELKETFLREALDNSEVISNITPALTDRILTLSTCTGWTYDSRRIVVARLSMVEVQP